MFCKNCGKEIDDNAVVCIHCGAAANVPQPANAAGLGPNGEMMHPVPKCKKCGYIGEHEHEKLFRPKDWAIGLFLLLFAGFGIIYFIIIAIIRSDEDKRETICPQCKAKKSSTCYY